MDMKTSLFEAVRNQILDNLNSKSEIVSAQLSRTVQSKTDTNKKAAVEFHIDIIFKTLESEEKVKMKVFTTNNSFQIQPFRIDSLIHFVHTSNGSLDFQFADSQLYH